MAKKGFLKAAVFLSLFAGLASGVSAQVTISGGFALSSMKVKIDSESLDGETGIGGNLYVDYLLPISVPLSLGAEIGIDTASIDYDVDTIEGTVIPLLLRAAYHFDLMPKLDLYLVGKIGICFGSAEIGNESESGFKGVGLGIDLGAAYYFTPRFGFFAEGGFDKYSLKKEVSESGYDYNYNYYSHSSSVEAPFSRFITFGISTKF